MAIFKTLKWKIVLFYTYIGYIKYIRSITPQSRGPPASLDLLLQFDASHQSKQSLLQLSSSFILPPLDCRSLLVNTLHVFLEIFRAACNGSSPFDSS